jgi:hypothetical protein
LRSHGPSVASAYVAAKGVVRSGSAQNAKQSPARWSSPVFDDT